MHRRFTAVAGHMSPNHRLKVHLTRSTSIQLLRGLHVSAASRDRSFTNLLAGDTPPAVQVSSISEKGIHLADGLAIPGPCMFLEGKVFLWDVPGLDMSSRIPEERWKGWNRDRFLILETVTPRPGEFVLF